jgi:hypothetical protein
MILNFCTNSNHDFYCTCLSVCLVFYYPPDPIRGGPPRAALSGGGLAQTPHPAHPYKELRPPGFLIAVLGDVVACGSGASRGPTAAASGPAIDKSVRLRKFPLRWLTGRIGRSQRTEDYSTSVQNSKLFTL